MDYDNDSDAVFNKDSILMGILLALVLVFGIYTTILITCKIAGTL
jgi:hypothetical protein